MDHFGKKKHVLPYPKGETQIHNWGQGMPCTVHNMISLVNEVKDACCAYAKWWYGQEVLSQIQEIGRDSGVCVYKS